MNSPSQVANPTTPEIAPDDFARRFAIRAPNLMWLLGAGASASAGVPTACDMIWDFKQRLFVSQRHASPKSVADLSSRATRALLQQHVDSLGNLPAAGSDDEYAAMFEAVFPAERDRQTYIAAKVDGAKPSYGHIALASFMKESKCRIVWTTNFDPLNADACARVYGTTGALTVGTLDAPSVAHGAIADNRYPLEVKLHGDFRSRRLKNTSDELREQDQAFRHLLTSSCTRFGLVVAGYSGRDRSIMEALGDVLAQPDRFPAGLFWLIRDGERVPDAVADLLRRTQACGVETGIVRIASFDEVLRDLVRVGPLSDAAALEEFGKARRRWSPAPVPSGKKGWPVLRFNALSLVEMPTVCRLVGCDIGNTRDVRSAVASAGVDILAARAHAGVLAFGPDSAVRTAFAPYSIEQFDLHTLTHKRLAYESSERGLLRDALARALERDRGLKVVRWSVSHLLAPMAPADSQWAPLRRLAGGQLNGTVPGHAELTWREGIGLRLEWANGQLWLVFEPKTVYDGVTEATKALTADFSRERTVRRYNRVLHDLIAFWADHLAGGQQPVRAFGIGDGVDAAFILGSATAFSHRGGA